MDIFDKNITKNSLPHNFSAEKMILSCIIFNSDVIEIIKPNLPIHAFYFKNHQELYSNLLIMKENNINIDFVTVTSFLQAKGVLSKIGGIKILIDLGAQIPAVSYLSEYVSIVKETFLKRCLIRLGYTIVNSGYSTNNSLETIFVNTEQELFYLTNQFYPTRLTTTTEILNNVFLDLKEKVLNPNLSGLPSGFLKLDELTQGFQKSDLVVIAGRPSLGKTALGLNIALNNIKLSKLPILFCSLEMSKEQILYRILSMETEVNQMKLKSGDLDKMDWIKLTKIMRIFAKLPFYIDDTPNLSSASIRSKIKTIVLEQKSIGLVIIDYLQLMQSFDSKAGNRAQELAQITRDLKILAKEFNIPIIALSQLSRNVDNRINKRPILSDLRESGSIEQDADVVLLLSRYNMTSLSDITSKNLIETDLILAKHRNGPTGVVKLKFNLNQIKFYD